MDDFEIDRQALVETFAVEARERLDDMEHQLLALEASPDDPEALNALFRAAHTLKGGAGMVGFHGPRDLAHDLESLLERARAGATRLTPAVITLLLAAVDHLRRAISAAAAGHEEDGGASAGLKARLAAAGATPDGAAAPAPASTPADPSAASAADPAQADRAQDEHRTLRVAVGKLDRMMDLSGEIAVARGRLADLLEHGERASPEQLLEAHREGDRLFLDLQDLIMKARMVPLGPVFQQQLRTVRDAATLTGKQVDLLLEGAEVEVDTAVVEAIRDPLTHLVRNAVDHGVEASDVRRAAGKDPVGRVTLRGFRDAGVIVVQVEDDGGGLDRARIATRAAAMGLVTGVSPLSTADISRLIFAPGLSTSADVTAISGRGVGMDVVRRNVEMLRGSVTVKSAAGHGTTFTLRLPLTLAIIQGFKVAAAGEIYVLPLDAVVECVEMPAEERARPEGAGVIPLRGAPLPYLRLRALFNLSGPPPARENVVVVHHDGMRAGLAVDSLLGESQTVIKPLGKLFQGVAGVSGSSILGDGRVALILEVPGLLREALRRAAAPVETAPA